jgi:ATP-binding cassette subfamily F protein 3
MLLHPSNFLLLDEPTNHLDLRAKDVLLNALKEFNGTVVFVSHDRYFIDNLATKVIEVVDGRVDVFPGGYEDFMWRKQNAVVADPYLPKEGKNGAPSGPTEEDADEGVRATQETSKAKRINPIKLKQMQDRAQELEDEITRLEEGIAECEAALLTFVSADQSKRLMDLQELRRGDLEKALAEWEEISSAIETNA